MLKSEKGNMYVNKYLILIIGLIFAAIIIRLLVGENGLIQQKKEEKAREKLENNIVIELTDSAK